jgi:AcrR family transcriptional regulator
MDIKQSGFHDSRTDVNRKNDLPERILDESEKLFAEKGFSGTSIREITKKADCNVAAVNYHFHGKENLYIEVFRRRMKLLAAQRISNLKKTLSSETQIDLHSLIRSFVEIFLEPFIKDNSGNSLMKLMMHERHEPHLPKSLFLNEIVQPTRNIMRQALLVVCPKLDRVDADLCLHSIVAQLLNLLHAQELYKDLDKDDMPLLDAPKSISHIIKFSAAGIYAYSENK